ncbi:hypothetical protein ACFL0Z_00195 [Patescibacteria group bacterium]
MSKSKSANAPELASLGRVVKRQKNDLEAADDLLSRIVSGENKKKELEISASLVAAKAEQVSSYSPEAAKRFNKELEDLRFELEKIETELRQLPVDEETAKQRRYQINLELRVSQERLRQAEEKLKMALAEQEEAEKVAAEEEEVAEEKEREEELEAKETELIEKLQMSQGKQPPAGNDSDVTPPV